MNNCPFIISSLYKFLSFIFLGVGGCCSVLPSTSDISLSGVIIDIIDIVNINPIIKIDVIYLYFIAPPKN